METTKLPESYKPFRELVICSNSLINGKVPIEIEGHIPFLVGRGVNPQVWLSVPLQSGWTDLVISNKEVESRSKTLKEHMLSVELFDELKQVDVLMWKTKILSVVQDTEEKAVIKILDLRPFNLLIYGGVDGLHIGGQMLRGNIMENVNTMIGIGGAP